MDTTAEDHYNSIVETIERRSKEAGHKVTLVAVSKTKPKEAIEYLYNVYGHRVFGENYIQELHEKGTSMEASYPEIQWHFIGRLQSNKLKLLCSTPNLACIETVHSIDIAKHLEKVLAGMNKTLDVMVQINSSGEEQKGGVEVDEAISVIKEVMAMEHLRFKGIMTIGMVGAAEENFEVMHTLGERVKSELGLDHLEISMGMSADYELAIEKGSTIVRIGTALFGARDYSKKATTPTSN